eukprot:TRINITY_DN2607_c0_g1_i1.p1 TRINITY_DN2607_c0_g1~~TRINITY_DN2607_c0_g1_i1.p1  ORF type:complete len:182 (+),score=89.51 TRINITY_DN2607_c0_g1_i1:47-592(+)
MNIGVTIIEKAIDSQIKEVNNQFKDFSKSIGIDKATELLSNKNNNNNNSNSNNNDSDNENNQKKNQKNKKKQKNSSQIIENDEQNKKIIEEQQIIIKYNNNKKKQKRIETTEQIRKKYNIRSTNSPTSSSNQLENSLNERTYLKESSNYSNNLNKQLPITTQVETSKKTICTYCNQTCSIF